jgi:chromosome segregation ATPase
MSDFEKHIGRLKEGIEKAKQLREYAAARKEVLEQQLREIENEIRAQGIEPEKLDEEIKRLEAEARQALEEAEKLIPWELIKAGSRNRNGGK